MKRALLAIGAAAMLTVALPMSADAQRGPLGGGGPPAAGAPAGGGAGGGGFAGRGGGGGHVGSAPIGRSAPLGGGPSMGVRPGPNAGLGGRFGPGVVARGGSGRFAATDGRGVWRGGDSRHRHRFHRGGAFALGFGAPYYDDYATPYAYDDDDCYRIRRVQTPRGWVARRVWVCD